MRTLVYKRTHNGDPDSQGRFGCNDCMGRVRAWGFDAVIGVGGQGAEARQNDIAGKVNWIGIGPHRTKVPGMRDPVLTFDHFLYFGTTGPELCLDSPKLAQRMYGKKARVVMSFSPQEALEVEQLLEEAKSAPPSPACPASAKPTKRKCHSSPRPPKRKPCRAGSC